MTQKFTQNRKTLVNVLSGGIWRCLKRERDIGTKATLSDEKTAFRRNPALNQGDVLRDKLLYFNSRLRVNVPSFSLSLVGLPKTIKLKTPQRFPVSRAL